MEILRRKVPTPVGREHIDFWFGVKSGLRGFEWTGKASLSACTSNRNQGPGQALMTAMRMSDFPCQININLFAFGRAKAG
ncbi:hypothetical protein Trco_007591 [Trichoderma cornu-damae]|uniref:Uncharacterized protein n=1 Tax=Trichoderma cornu-damae TaxID=654480 RepID=A0A9P8QEI6_9HYPO|nr:hypothetical protein Trco_007591 [Trichoderma cornu-damae]